MKISLIATVRNEHATIRTFVESLLAQSALPDEIVIVDGASTDGTLQILEEFSAAGRIRVISQKCNIAEGRNLGIRHAQHELIAVTDAGCRVDVNWIANILKCFNSTAAPDVVAGNFRFDSRTPLEEAIAFATFSPARETTTIAQYFPSSRSVAFRKSAWERAKGYPEWLYAAEDTLLSIRLRQLGCKFVFCKEAVVYWRPRETWRQLARQRLNFSRGNARVGIGTSGYLTNVRYHGATLILLAASFMWWPLAIAAALVAVEHVRRHLWKQASHAKQASGSLAMFFRVLAVMEFVRLVNIVGFVAGRMDRLTDPSFKRRQKEWMGVDSVEALDSPRSDAEPRLRIPYAASAGIALAAPLLALALLSATGYVAISLIAALVVALACSVVLVLKSFYDFSQTGPPLKEDILRHYRAYSIFALLRLTGWAFVLCAIMGAIGGLLYTAGAVVAEAETRFAGAVAAAAGGVLVLTGMQFCRHLLFLPGSIAASYHYRISRLYPLWRRLTPRRIFAAQWGLGIGAATLFALAGLTLLASGEARPAAGYALLALSLPFAALALSSSQVPAPVAATPSIRPNILMIGSDTLRADRLGAAGYPRRLTPFIDSLAQRGAQFTSCYVPCARTAPSLLSLLTGTWPHRHGIRDNFIGDDDVRLTVPTLPALLAEHGYRTAAVSDWSGGDLGKFPLGFEILDIPKDQWNIKYLIRQGPKDLRLFLSLFTHNRFGKRLLPELYYLAGVPLTRLIGRDARALISDLAIQSQPFFLNVFISTTHPPFGAEYPYYTLWSDEDYAGESKFAMARLTDPWEIIRRQGDTKKDFDLKQVIDLYDGCVQNFDDEVKRIVEHVHACRLEDNTIIVIYSDHGMEFFEHETWGQGNSVRGDMSARIPLVILDPRLDGTGTCSEVVRSIDVAPTLLELAGIKPPHTMQGSSLAAYLSGTASHRELPAFNETGLWLTDLPGMPANHLRYPGVLELLDVPDKNTGTLAIKPEYRQAIITAKDRMVRVGPWKLVYQPTSDKPLFSLFNVISDPECRYDLAAEQPDTLKQLQDILHRWLEGGAGRTELLSDSALAHSSAG